MTDKQIIIDEERMFECVWCKYDFKESEAHFILSENPNECVCSDCMTEWADNLLCDFKRKEQECEELRQYHNKCCKEFENEKQELLEKYNQVSINFYNGDYCNTEHCSLLKAKEQECERLKEGLNLILTVQKNCKLCPHQKLDVDVLVCDLDCATAFKKIAKQTLKKLENKNV